MLDLERNPGPVTTALVIAAGVAVFGFGCTSGVLQRPVADALIRLSSLRPPPLPAGLPDVTVVALDGESMGFVGHEWPWPRSLHAKLVERLDAAGAAAIVLDLDLATRWDRREDMALARAIKDSRRVVLAAFHHREEAEARGAGESLALPAPEFAIGAAGIGHALLQPDPDGVIRHGLFSRRGTAHGLPSLAEAAIDVALGRAPVPRRAGTYRIDYRRAWPEIPSRPLVELLEAPIDPERFRGRIVLVGPTAEELRDRWKTPLGGERPGVWIQAIAIRTLLAELAGQQTLEAAGLGTTLLLLLVVSLLAGAVPSASRGGDRRGLRLHIGLAVAVVGLSLWSLLQDGRLLDPTLPLMALVAHRLWLRAGPRLRQLHLGRGPRPPDSRALPLPPPRHPNAVPDLESVAGLERALEAVVTAASLREGYSDVHCRRMVEISGVLAEQMGLPPHEQSAIRLGALLYDLGKLELPEDLLQKPGALSAEEQARMEEHAKTGARRVQDAGGLPRTTLECVRSHHERWDGSGYPDRLAGEEIPLGARIVAIVSAWESLASDRPYRRALAPDAVRDILRKASGQRFDPLLVPLLFRILDEEGPEEPPAHSSGGATSESTSRSG